MHECVTVRFEVSSTWMDSPTLSQTMQLTSAGEEYVHKTPLAEFPAIRQFVKSPAESSNCTPHVPVFAAIVQPSMIGSAPHSPMRRGQYAQSVIPSAV